MVNQEHEITPAKLLDVLKALQVQAEHLRQLLDLHALLSLLQAAALVAEKLVIRIQRLRRTAPRSKKCYKAECSHTIRVAMAQDRVFKGYKVVVWILVGGKLVNHVQRLGGTAPINQNQGWAMAQGSIFSVLGSRVWTQVAEGFIHIM